MLALSTEYSRMATDALGYSARVMRVVEQLNDTDVVEFCQKLLKSCPEVFPS